MFVYFTGVLLPTLGAVLSLRSRFDNDYLMAKSQKAFRRAAKLSSKTARLFCQIFIAMSIARMIFESFAMR